MLDRCSSGSRCWKVWFRTPRLRPSRPTPALGTPPCGPTQDNATFIHIHKWTNDRNGWLHSVGVLLAAPPGTPDPLELPPPLVANAVLAATNATLVPALTLHAGALSRAPLLVYVASNVSLGLAPPLPASGVVVRRPLVIVGLQSLVTSVDLGMVVNQLNETGSPYSNVTFVGLALENCAPGDAGSAIVAGPFSIAISNNLWAASYNRYAAVRGGGGRDGPAVRSRRVHHRTTTPCSPIMVATDCRAGPPLIFPGACLMMCVSCCLMSPWCCQASLRCHMSR
jgi:hypothetical protein